MLKIKNSTFTKVNNPEIDAFATELLAIETKLGVPHECDYLKHFSVFTSDTPLSLTNIDENIFEEIVHFFENAGIYRDIDVECALDSKDDNAECFIRYIKEVESMGYEFPDNAFGYYAFEAFDYRQKGSDEMKEYFESGGRHFEYEVHEIDRRNELIQQLMTKISEITSKKTLTYYNLSSSMDDPSNAEEVIHFWVSENTLVAVTAFRYL